MNSFYDHHKDSIRFNYRCFDRILLNGLIQPFQQPERVVGVFDVYRHFYPVSSDILRGAAEQFQVWVKEQAGEWNAPIVEAPKGRRDEFVDPYFKGARADQIVVILKAREPARIMTAIGDRKQIAGIFRSQTAGLCKTTSMSTTSDGGGCLCACARTFRSQPGSASSSTSTCATRGSSAPRRRATTSTTMVSTWTLSTSPPCETSSPRSTTATWMSSRTLSRRLSTAASCSGSPRPRSRPPVNAFPVSSSTIHDKSR